MPEEGQRNCHEGDFLERARELLLSPEIRAAAEGRRERFRERVDELHPLTSYQELKRLRQNVMPEFLRHLAEHLPPLKMSPRMVEGLAENWLERFFSNAACTETPLEQLANEYAAAIVSEVSCDTLRMRSVVPLLNFRCAGEFEIDGAVEAKPYKAWLRKIPLGANPAWQGFHIFPSPDEFYRTPGPPLFSMIKWVLIVDVTFPKNLETYTWSNSSEQHRVQQALLTGLRLFHDGDVSVPMQYLSRDSLRMANSRAMAWQVEVGGIGEEYELSTELVSTFLAFWQRRQGQLIALSELPHRIQIALEYFNSSYNRIPEGRFLDLCIALESLFGVEAEQRYRLSLRVAALVGNSPAEAIGLHDEVKKLVDIRNKIAHGTGKLKETEFQNEVRQKLEIFPNLVDGA